MFDNVKPFDWKELDNKILEVKVEEETSEGIKTTVAMGQIANTDNLYVLAIEHKKVTPCP